MTFASPETKVGLFTIIALVVIFAIFLWLSGAQIFNQGTTIEAIFDHVEGLRPGALVQLAGVDVGRVSHIYFDDSRVVVAMQIKRSVIIPRPAKVLISSSGVIGDKFLEITPCKPEEIKNNGQRLMGESPVTMEKFSATAYEALDSLKIVSANLGKITAQLQGIDIVQLFSSINNIALVIQRLAQTNEPRLNDLLFNIDNISAQLAEVTITANRFVKDMENNGQTAANLKQIITNAEKIVADLEKFTAILASRQQNIDELLQNAPETMQAIKVAADNVNKAVDQLTTGDGALSQVNETITQTNQAVEKVNRYIAVFEQVSLKNSVGAGYQKDGSLLIDYKMNLHLDPKNAFILGWDDIGQKNSATIQWALASPNYVGRVGLYKNKFGLGLDVPVSSRFIFGINLWDSHSPYLGLNSSWEMTPHWTLSFGGESNLENEDNTWNFEVWRNF
jgi:phospholipid/cholesterol/gamma-HCH transport system substrate-binding protein